MTSGSSHELREMVARLEAFSSLIYKEGQSSVCERMAYQWQTHHTLNVKNALVDHVRGLTWHWRVGYNVGHANKCTLKRQQATSKLSWPCWRAINGLSSRGEVSTEVKVLERKLFKGTQSAKDLEKFYGRWSYTSRLPMCKTVTRWPSPTCILLRMPSFDGELDERWPNYW